MVIQQSHIKGAAARPTEYQAPLVVHPDAVTTIEIAMKRLEMIARRRPQILQVHGGIKRINFTCGNGDDPGWNPRQQSPRTAIVKSPCRVIPE